MSMEEFENILTGFPTERCHGILGYMGEHILYVGEDYRPDNIVGYYMMGSRHLGRGIHSSLTGAGKIGRRSLKKVDDPTRPMSCDDLFGPGESA